MTEEQRTLLSERYPQIFGAIDAANIGISSALLMQIDPTLLGNIARLWQVETNQERWHEIESHNRYTLRFTHETVDVCLYVLTPKTAKR